MMLFKYTVKGRVFEINGSRKDILAVISYFEQQGNNKIGRQMRLQAKNRFPSSKEIAHLIEHNGVSMRHSYRSIAKHFLGKPIVARDDPIGYHRLHALVQRAQRQLSKKHGGKFKSKRKVETKNGNGGANKPFKEFTFVKK